MPKFMSSRYRYLILLLPLILSLQGCYQPQSPEITFQKVTFSFSSFDKLNGQFYFQAHNPNTVALRGKINYELLVSGKKIIAGESPDQELAAGKNSTLLINSSLDIPQAVGSLSSLLDKLKQGEKELPFELRGNFQAELPLLFFDFPLTVPLNYSGTLPLPQLPEIKLQQVQITGMDLSTLSLRISTRMHNPNDFPLELSKLAYRLLADDGNTLLDIANSTPVNLARQSDSTQSWQIQVRLDKLNTKMIEQLRSGQLRLESVT